MNAEQAFEVGNDPAAGLIAGVQHASRDHRVPLRGLPEPLALFRARNRNGSGTEEAVPSRS